MQCGPKNRQFSSFSLAAVDLLEGSGSNSQGIAMNSVSRRCSFILICTKLSSIDSSCSKMADFVIFRRSWHCMGALSPNDIFRPSTSTKDLDPQHRK